MPPEATEPLPVPDTGVHHEVSPARTAPSWGKPLTEGDYAALAKSWITRELAEEAMLRRVDTHEGREIVGQKGNRDCAGLIFRTTGRAKPRPTITAYAATIQNGQR